MLLSSGRKFAEANEIVDVQLQRAPQLEVITFYLEGKGKTLH